MHRLLYYAEAKTVNEGTAEFATVKDKETITTFEFDQIDDLKLAGFNHQNVIDSLVIESKNDGFSVVFEPCYGASLGFACHLAKVSGVRIYA